MLSTVSPALASMFSGVASAEPAGGSPFVSSATGIVATGPDGQRLGPFATTNSGARGFRDDGRADLAWVKTDAFLARGVSAIVGSDPRSGVTSAESALSELLVLNGVASVDHVRAVLTMGPDGEPVTTGSFAAGMTLGGTPVGTFSEPAVIDDVPGVVVHFLELTRGLPGGCARLVALRITTEAGWEIVAGDATACPSHPREQPKLTLARTYVGLEQLTTLGQSDVLHGASGTLSAQGRGEGEATSFLDLPEGPDAKVRAWETRRMQGNEAEARGGLTLTSFEIPGLLKLVAPVEASVRAWGDRNSFDTDVQYTTVQLEVQGQHFEAAARDVRIPIKDPNDPDGIAEIGYVAVNEKLEYFNEDFGTGERYVVASYALFRIMIDSAEPQFGLPPDVDFRVGYAYAEVRVPGEARLVAEAIASPGVVREGTPVTFTYTARSEGLGLIFDTTVSDARVGHIPACDAPLLRRSESTRCGLTRPVDDADQGGVPVLAEATGPWGEALSATAFAPLRIIHPSLTLSLAASPPIVHPDDPVTLTYVVRNTGDSVLRDVAIDDDAFGPTGTVPSLAPGAEATVVFSAPEDGAGVHRSRAIGFDEIGLPVTATAEDAVAVIHPGISLTVEATDIVRAGDPAVANYRVANVGDTPLSSVRLVDGASGTDADLGTLEPGAETLHTATFSAPDASFVLAPQTTGADRTGALVAATDEEAVRVIHSFLGVTVTPSPDLLRDDGTVTWSVRAENSGDNTLADLVLTDAAGVPIGTLASFPPGGSALFQRVEALDRDQTLAVTGVATDEAGLPVEGLGAGDVRVIHPALSLDLSAEPAIVHAGDDVLLTFVVTNTGDADVFDVLVADDVFGTAGTIPVLTPGTSETLTIRAAEVEGGLHRGTAAGTDELDLPVRAADDAAVLVIHPGIALAVDAPAIVRGGDMVVATYTVTNTGDVALDPVTILDAGSGLEGDLSALDAGGVKILQIAFPAPSASFDLSPVVTGADPAGGFVSDVASRAVRVIHTGLDVVVVPDPAVLRGSGDVSWTIRVENTGDNTLTGITVRDADGALLGDLDALAAGATHAFSRTDAVTSDATLVATATGTDEAGLGATATDDGSVRVIHPALGLVLSADPSMAHVGDEVLLTFVVTNTGDSPVFDIRVGDDVFGAAGRILVLSPGETATLTLRGGQPEGGLHRADAAGLDELGLSVTAADDATVVLLHPALAVSVDAPGVVRAGDPLTATYTVTNTGDAALSDVRLVDPSTGTDVAIGSLGPGETATWTATIAAPLSSFALRPTATGTDPTGLFVEGGATRDVRVIHTDLGVEVTPSPSTVRDEGAVEWTIRIVNLGDNTLTGLVVRDADGALLGSLEALLPGANHAFTRADLVSSDASLVATATATDEAGLGVTESDDGGVRDIHPALALALSAEPTVARVGDRVTLTFVVTNIGDAPVSGILVADDGFGPAGTVPALAPGASAALVLSGLQDEEGLHAALAAGTDELGLPVSAADGAGVEVIHPALDVSVDAPAIVRAGDPLTATYTVTNTGDAALTDVHLVDPATGMDVAIGTLGPGDSASRTVTLAAPDASVGLAPAAVGFDATGRPVEDADARTVRVIHSLLTVDVTAAPGTLRDEGTVEWLFVVTNTGDNVLSDVVLVDAEGAEIGRIETLAPGASASFSRTETVSSDTGVLGTASGTDEAGLPVAGSGAGSVAVIHPALDLVVTPSASVVRAGDLVTLTYVVTNTGDAPIAGILVTDGAFGVVGSIPSLAPGESATLVVTASETGSGLHAGTAAGTDALGLPVTDAAETSLRVIHPGLAVFVEAPAVVRAGDVVDATYTIVNTGDSPLSDVRIRDPATGTDIPIGTLAPGASVTVPVSFVAPSGSFTLLPATSGTDETGAAVGSGATLPVRVIHSGLLVDVLPDPDTIRDAGDVTWTVVATNSGDSTLADVRVTDALGSLLVSAPTLAPGETASGTRTDAIAATTALHAAGTATDEAGLPVAASDSATARVIHPALGLLATASPSTVRAGTTVTVTYLLTNDGDAPVYDVVVTDPLFGDVGTFGVLGPGESAVATRQFGAAGDVAPVATAAGTDELGLPVGDEDGYAVDVQAPAVTVVKTATPTRIMPGDLVTYTFTVTNTGDAPVDAVRVDDDHLGPVGTVEGLAPGAAVTFVETVAVVETTRNVAFATAEDETGGFVDDDTSALVEVDAPVPTDLRAPTSVWQTVGSETVDLAPGERRAFTFAATNPSDAVSRIYGLAVAVAAKDPSRAYVVDDVPATVRLFRADGALVYTGTLPGVESSSSFSRTGFSASSTSPIVTFRLPKMLFLEMGGRLEITFAVERGPADGRGDLVVYFPSTEDPADGTNKARTTDRILEFTNVFPARGGWFPLHNSYDPYDEGMPLGHAWKQYSWKAETTTDGYGKATLAVH